MSLRIGLTGLNGWLGSHVRKALESNSFSIIDLDFITRTLHERPKQQEINKLDWVFHFGAKTNIIKSFEEPFDIYRNNLISTLTAIEIANISQAHLLYLSSYVYGNPEYNPIDENHNVRPNNPYMSSKWIAEQLCTNICQQLNIPLTVFRTFNIYGAGLKKGRLISDLLHNIMNNEDLLLNDPSPIRDYLYIEDFINLIFYLLDSKKSSEGIFNVGSGESHSNLEVAQTIQTLTSPLSQIKILSKPRKNDIPVCTIDNQKIKKHFNWQPKYDLLEGLSHIIKAMGKVNLINH